MSSLSSFIATNNIPLFSVLADYELTGTSNLLLGRARRVFIQLCCSSLSRQEQRNC